MHINFRSMTRLANEESCMDPSTYYAEQTTPASTKACWTPCPATSAACAAACRGW